MFVDYYQILGISYPSNADEIKSAYRRLSLKWHPDKNVGIDTSERMVEINEAYYILKDNDKKLRYDQEYLLFEKFKKQNYPQTTTEPTQRCNESKQRQNTKQQHYNSCQEYKFSNDRVKEDMESANSFAKELVTEFLKKLNETSNKAAAGAWNEMKPYLVVALILPFLFTLIRSCQ